MSHPEGPALLIDDLLSYFSLEGSNGLQRILFRIDMPKRLVRVPFFSLISGQGSRESRAGRVIRRFHDFAFRIDREDRRGPSVAPGTSIVVKTPLLKTKP